MIRFPLFALACVWITSSAAAVDADLKPDDPFAAIDGKPIYVGEINWTLTQRIDVKDLDRIDRRVVAATAQVLVRRHLAMKALRGQGGEAIAANIKRRVDAFAPMPSVAGPTSVKSRRRDDPTSKPL